MKQFLSNFWKWPVLLLGLVLAGVVVWLAGKHDRGSIVAERQSPSFLSRSRPVNTNDLLTGQTETTAHEEPSTRLSSQSMDAIRQQLSEERNFALKLQKENAGELLSQLEVLWTATGAVSTSAEEKAL